MGLKPDLVQEERHQKIIRQVLTHRVARVKDLAESLGVHEMTVRRDLDALAEEGLLERIHGGARVRNQASAELSYQLRAAQNTEAKAKLARKALSLIDEGDTVALDASTTALALARILGTRVAMVITSGLDAAEALASSGTPLILVGGVFHPPARSFIALPDTGLSQLHPDKLFFSAKGFTVRAGLTDAHLPEVETKIRLIKSASLVVVVLDHSKFGREALGTIATLEQVDILLTDREPTAPFKDALEAAGVRLLIADDEAL
ncbi:DeoR/GlpR family DNA-binding transcription regulator [soil metagenome]